jgi:hypothetical protein
MVRKRVYLLLAVCAVFAGASAPASAAVVNAPGWEALIRAVPTHLAPGGSGLISVLVTNIGGKESELGATVTDTLPTGFTGVSEEGWVCSGATPDVCTYNTLPETLPEEVKEPVLAVNVAPDVSEGPAVNVVQIAGGGAAGTTTVSSTLTVSSSPAKFGLVDADGFYASADGTFDSQAGSHPYAVTFGFSLNVDERHLPVGEAKDVTTQQPPGLIGDPVGIPRCTRQQFDDELCAPESEVGVAEISLGGLGERTTITPEASVYNLVPSPGVPAQFGFKALGVVVLLDASVRSGGDYGVTIHGRGLPQNQVVQSMVTLWGVPAEASHDSSRFGINCFRCSATGAPTPFLTLPTSCSGPESFSATVLSWQEVNAEDAASFVTHDQNGAPSGLTGCEHLAFEPALSLAPDTTRAGSPAGLAVDLRVPQEGLTNVEGLAEANVKNVSVTLPEGLTVNPSRASGLQACSAAQSAVGTENAPTCPIASRIGHVLVTTPLLNEKLEGGVYVLSSNPPDVKLLVAASGAGVNVKLPGTAHLDETTGRITATFQEAPELPFSDFKMTFDGGPKGALSTPVTCGMFTTNSDLTPWDSPSTADAAPSSSFVIDSGIGGGSCSSGGSFGPAFVAGTTNNSAGGFSPLSVTITRQDGEQELSGVQVKTPPGLLGVLKSVPLCQEPQASQGTCGSESLIGHTTVSAGPGPEPLYVQGGRVYLTGPYKGAPFGLSIVVPAIAGPFNLGNVIVRASIAVDPATAALTVTSDPLPTILKGVPVQIRTVNVTVDREGFTFNPTNCVPLAVGGTLTSTHGVAATVSSRFQAANCASLPFKPSFKVSTQGSTNRKNGASLDVKVGSSGGQANIGKVRVSLPKQLPSRLSTLKQACRDSVFNQNPAACPAGSNVGSATATTPLLAHPLTGPAYLVSHGGAAFPDLEVVLQGEGITLILDGKTDIKKGITTSSFNTIPDAPIGSFDLKLPEGPHSALAAPAGKLCQQKLAMPTTIQGQNGAVIKQSTKIAVSGCPKKKAKKASRKHHKKR